MSAALLAAMAIPFMVGSITTAKLIAFAIIMTLFIFSPFIIHSEYCLLFLIGLVFFPVTLTIGGRDTLTTATFAIFWTMFLLLFRCLLKPSVKAEKVLLIWMAVLFFIAAIGVFRWHGIYFAKEVRHFVNFCSSGILFLILVNAPGLYGFNRIAFAKKLLAVVIWIVAVHLLIGIAVYHWPDVGKLFSVFLVRTKEAVAIKTVGGYERISSLIMSSEGIGEIISVLIPFVIFLACEEKRKYWLVYGVMVLGLIMANTRAGVILFVVANAAMFVFYRFKVKRSIVCAWAIIILFSIPILIFHSQVVQEATERMNEIREKVVQQDNIVEILNRTTVWYDAWDVTVSNLSLFGNGPAPSHVVGLNDRNMHSLLLTLVYQFGIVGAVLYLSLFLYILFKLIYPRSSQYDLYYKNLRFTCILSILIFFLNEIKFEFNRGDSYQQMIWVIFAICYLISRATHYDYQEYLVSSHNRVVGSMNSRPSAAHMKEAAKTL